VAAKVRSPQFGRSQSVETFILTLDKTK